MHNAQQTIHIPVKQPVPQADTLVQKVPLVLAVGRELEMNNALQDFQPIIKAQLIVETAVLELTVGISPLTGNPVEKFAVNVQQKNARQTVAQIRHAPTEHIQTALLSPVTTMPATNSATLANTNVTIQPPLQTKELAKLADIFVQVLAKTVKPVIVVPDQKNVRQNIQAKNLARQAETVTQLPRLHNKLATPLVTNALTPVHRNNFTGQQWNLLP